MKVTKDFSLTSKADSKNSEIEREDKQKKNESRYILEKNILVPWDHCLCLTILFSSYKKMAMWKLSIITSLDR